MQRSCSGVRVEWGAGVEEPTVRGGEGEYNIHLYKPPFHSFPFFSPEQQAQFPFMCMCPKN